MASLETPPALSQQKWSLMTLTSSLKEATRRIIHPFPADSEPGEKKMLQLFLRNYCKVSNYPLTERDNGQGGWWARARGGGGALV